MIDDLKAKGFYVGRKVQLTRRISLNMEDQADASVKQYTDVVKGTIGYVEGMVKDLPVISFTKQWNGKTWTASAAIKEGNLTLDVKEPAAGEAASSSGGGGSGSGSGKKSLDKEFAFLKVGESADKDRIEIHDKWSANLATTCLDTKVKNIHSKLGMTLAAVIETVPVYTAKDFHVVTRNSKVEVWTGRDFPAYTLVLAPETTEWKERYWTTTRSVLVKYGTMYQNAFNQYCLRQRIIP